MPKIRTLILTLLFCCTYIAMINNAIALSDDEELLPEDQAFAFSAMLLPDNVVEVRWNIADGYYMYQNKMGYEILGDTQLSQAVSLPDGKIKNDALFGDVEVYTSEFKLALSIEDASKPFELVAKGQGCNEPIGVCYPPITHKITFDSNNSTNSAISQSTLGLQSDGLIGLAGMGQSLPIGSDSASDFSAENSPALLPIEEPEFIEIEPQSSSILIAGTAPVSTSAENSTNSAELESIEQLRDLLSGGFEQPEFLDVEEAFKFSVNDISADKISASFEIADGYYLYQNKLGFISTAGANISETILPDAEIKEDQYFGTQSVYKKSFSVPLLLMSNKQGTDSMTLQASYQGCAEQGICYPPVTKIVNLKLPPIIAEAEAQSSTTTIPAQPVTAQLVTTPSAQQPATNKAPGKTLLSLLIGAFFAGILLTFTPCVLPLIPILSGIIAGQGEKLTRMRGGILAIIYVLGTAATYAAMGAIAGATGEQLQAYFQNAWAIGILALVFVLMALSMFGLYEIQMPAAIQSRLQSKTGKLSGSVPTVFLLGLVSALIVGACVSPVLISFLGIAVTRADPVLGAQMMFVMSLGMGIPLVALGFGAGYLIPKAGKWMDMVKYVFGVMLIGVAIYLLGVLPFVPVLLLWGIFFIVISSYLGAPRSNTVGGSGWQSLARGTSMVLLIWGIAAIIGGFYGQRDLLKPLPTSLFAGTGSNSPTNQGNEFHLFTRVSTLEEIDQQFVLAASSNKRIMLDFYADWCTDCIKMEKSTFEHASVLNTLTGNYITLQVDVTDPNDPGPSAIKKRFSVFGPPAVLFFDSKGTMLEDKNFYGYVGPDQFLTLISN